MFSISFVSTLFFELKNYEEKQFFINRESLDRKVWFTEFIYILKTSSNLNPTKTVPIMILIVCCWKEFFDNINFSYAKSQGTDILPMNFSNALLPRKITIANCFLYFLVKPREQILLKAKIAL